MRIAKNDTVHANLLKFSKMPRFIGSSLVVIVLGRRGACCQETSAKCQDLYGLLRSRILAHDTVDKPYGRASEVS